MEYSKLWKQTVEKSLVIKAFILYTTKWSFPNKTFILYKGEVFVSGIYNIPAAELLRLDCYHRTSRQSPFSTE